MDLKKLFKNNDAVSPVIGVILMVAITVILAAAIGSSVFGQGATKPAPQANIGITANETGTATTIASVKLEHLGGDTIIFGNSTTKIMASLGSTSGEVKVTGNMSVGDMKILQLVYSDGTRIFIPGPVSGDTVNIKIIDVKTNQLISNKDVRF